MNDLFTETTSSEKDYSAKDIEVLEGLEPVRQHPGMYIGGTDESAMHHLAAEVIDNSMDEAVAGHASRIEVVLQKDGSLMVSDNGKLPPKPRQKPNRKPRPEPPRRRLRPKLPRKLPRPRPPRTLLPKRS